MGPRAGLNWRGISGTYRNFIPGPSSRSDLLYRLSYPGPHMYININIYRYVYVPMWFTQPRHLSFFLYSKIRPTQRLQSDILPGIKQSCPSLMSMTHLKFAFNLLANSLKLFQTSLCGICFEKWIWDKFITKYFGFSMSA